MNTEQLKKLERLLEQNTIESKLFINREIILFCTSLHILILKKSIREIANFMSTRKIQALIISPACFSNYNEIPLTNDITTFLFYLFPYLCHKNDLKQLCIQGQISTSLLNKRFEALLLISSLESIIIKCFNLWLTKQRCGKWQLYIPPYLKQNNVIYPTFLLFNKLVIRFVIECG